MPQSRLRRSPAQHMVSQQASLQSLHGLRCKVPHVHQRGELPQSCWGSPGDRSLLHEQWLPSPHLQSLQQSQVGFSFLSCFLSHFAPFHSLFTFHCSAKPKTTQCPAPSCPGQLVSEPAGYMHCMVCSVDYRSCGGGQKCCGTAGCLQVASAFAEAQAGSKKRIRCKACTEAGAPENAGPKDAACQGTLSEPCVFSGRSTLPSTTCTMCTSTFNKQLKAAYSFLRSSLLTEAADGGKKLDLTNQFGSDDDDF